MAAPVYVELHAKSAFSFLEATSTPEDLAAHCARLEQPALALTDAHGVYGAARFHFAARKLGVRALLGAEVAVSGGARLTLLAESQHGYQNLFRLLTRTKFRKGAGGKIKTPSATEDELAEHARGLVCLTGAAKGLWPNTARILVIPIVPSAPGKRSSGFSVSTGRGISM